MGALDGLRVVELGGGISASYATKLLRDLGAEVVKIESPSGDPIRQWGPWADGEAHDPSRGGGLFRYLNAGKRSILADGGGDVGLLASADVVVESLGPGCLERLVPGGRIETSALVRISDFGQDGAYRDRPATPFAVQAAGGWVSSHGTPGQAPVQVGGRLAEYAAGAFAGCAALTAALAARAGQPVVVDLSVMECLVGTLAYPMLFHATLTALGLPPPERRYSALPGIVRCRDGWCGINALTGQHWQDICVMFEAPEWAGAQRQVGFGGPELDRFLAHIQPFLDAHSVEEVVELSQAFRIPAAPIGTGESLPRLAQFAARSFFVSEPDGAACFPGPPWRLSATPAAPPVPAPRLGADTVETLRWSRPAASAPGPAGGPPRLDGVRVIDLGTFWAGPYATLYLGALGADVIKVESTRRPDGFRFSGAFPEEGTDWYERSGLWQATNLNKRDITLDLAQPAGHALFTRLVASADVVLENFSARVLEEFGLGYDELRRVKPDVILVRMPGFGLEGPWRDYVGWAMAFEQACGLAQVTGDGSRPLHPGGVLDPIVGMHAALVVQAALDHRRRTGEGQLIEIAQVEVGACLTAEQVIEHSLTGRILGGTGNRSPRFAPQGVYQCAPASSGDDVEWVALSVRDDADWQALVEALGRPAWASAADLVGVTGRQAAHDRIDAGIAAWTGVRSAQDVVMALRTQGLAVSLLLTAPAMYDEPQLAARRYFQSLDHPLTGTRRYPGWPMRFSPPIAEHRRGAPTLGQHNDEVLSDLLGLGPDDLSALRADGVIGERLAR